MPLFSFSEAFHIPLILSGDKKQTTRQPRKRALKVGQVLNCYYKPRMKKSCKNCLTYRKDGIPSYSLCPNLLNDKLEISYDCCDHSNYFGQAVILFIKPLDLLSMTDEEADDWAVADGFENFEKADEWFSVKYSQHGIDGSDWINWKWEVIHFEPRWIK